MQGADSARESLPRVGGGAERSEAEGLLETKESVIKLCSWRVFCHTENCSNYKNWCDRKIVTKSYLGNRLDFLGKQKQWFVLSKSNLAAAVKIYG